MTFLFQRKPCKDCGRKSVHFIQRTHLLNPCMMNVFSIFHTSSRILGLFLIIVMTYGSTLGAIRLPRIIGSGMVLQQKQAVPIWGWASPRERITIEFNGQLIKTRAGKDGKWRIELTPMEAGGPYAMTLSGKNTLTLNDILIGEVWICSGQSNMQWTVSSSNDAEQEIAAADYPHIRLFSVERQIQLVPTDDLDKGEWQTCTPATIPDFSAVAYFFGRDLQDNLQVPIGLIHTSWGGTNVETWISGPTITQIEGFEQSTEGLTVEAMQAMKAEQAARFQKILSEFGDSEGGIENGKAIWAAPGLDESDWKTMDVPGLWETKGLDGIDGVIWFRKTIALSESAANTSGMIHLGPIDDNEITWINGHQVGFTNAYNEPRNYAVSADHLQPGKNVITIRVEDTGGGGGLYGSADEMKLTLGNIEIPLAGNWKYRISPVGLELNSSGMGPNDKPTLLFNGMINPLIPYAFQGAIWYQGESNAGRAYQYRELFPALIRDWRGYWKRDFPFLFVQLANFKKAKLTPDDSDWAELREAQTMTLAEPHTGMALAIDIGEADDIHPRNKQDVGSRLALSARKVAYGQDIIHSGPKYASMEIKGKVIEITFDYVGEGLMPFEDKYGYLRGFSIAGEDQHFQWAQAEIIGNKVHVSNPAVSNPVAVRYAWADNPADANLYNATRLPAVPFRTDTWKGITYDKK